MPGAPARLPLAPGTCGFADASGMRLLALEAIADPAAIRATRRPGAPARAVAERRPLATVPGGPVLFVVRFVTRDTSALASMVTIDGATRWFHDLPAVDRGSGASVGRLDDGGAFPAAAMRIRVVSRVRGVLLVGMTWDGIEGENAYLLAADSSGAFRTLQHTYRCTASM